MNYNQALISARNGKALIFTGAGFSIGANAIKPDTPLPTGKKLAHILCNHAKTPLTDDLKMATNRFLKKKQTTDLINLLKEIFTVYEVSDYHQSIADIPWKCIYTTNYDNVFERAGTDVRKKFTPITLDKSPRIVSTQSSIIHINGFIDELDENSINASFKLTNTSYLTQQFRQSPWSDVFIRDTQIAHAIFFVGYSLYDFDIQEILFADSRLREKTFFIQYKGMSPEEIEDSDLNDFGTVMPIGVDQFAKDLISVDPLAINQFNEIILTSFDEIKASSTPITNIRDQDIYDLLLRGEITQPTLINKVLTNNRADYIIEFESEKSNAQNISTTENIVIHGDPANGKTILTHVLCAKYIQEGYNVFWLRNEAYDCFDEIEQIISTHEKAVLVFDNYTNKISLIQHASTKRLKNTKIILCIRTIEFERTQEELFFARQILSARNTIEINLNKLHKNDLKEISSFFERYGLWGNLASKTKSEKILHLERRCGSNMHGILLDLLKSPQVRDRINPIFAEMQKSDAIMKSMVAAFSLNIVNIDQPTVHMVAAMADDSTIFSPLFKNNIAVKQFLHNSQGVVIPKSAALAEYVLQNFPNTKQLISTLVDISKNTRRKAIGVKLYFDIYRDLASFRYIQRMLPEAGKRDSLVAFYEGIREIDIERKNPHFWLQYAIARLTYPDSKNLEHAKQCLDTGLSLAKNRLNYSITDLETQYARYHLEYSLNVLDNSELAFSEFLKANDPIQLIVKKERYKTEAFRPARLYEPFYKKFSSQFSRKQKETIMKASVDLSAHIERLSYHAREDKTIKAARENLNTVIEQTKRDLKQI